MTIMSEANALISLDFKQVFLSIVIILLAVKVLGTALDWLIDKLGLETKYSLKKKELIKTVENHNSDIENLAKADKQIEEKVCSLEAKIDKLTDVVTEGRIQSMRSEILDAACRLSKMDFTEEQYKNLFSVYTRYEEILKENDLTNGQVDVSFKFIEQRYQEQLQKGF